MGSLGNVFNEFSRYNLIMRDKITAQNLNQKKYKSTILGESNDGFCKRKK